MPNVVLLFPGQGSQTPGMGKDLADRFPAAKEVFLAADAAVGAPLSQLSFEGPAEELTLTHNAQPALLTHGAALWAVLRDSIGSEVVAAAGHSLGEFTAYHAADALSLPEAVRLVRRRGELMLEAGRKRPGTMAAILGTPTRPIERICEQATAEGSLAVPANFNAPGQVVISGEVGGVERASTLAKEAGAKAIPLKVSGAFHSPLMADAAAGLEAALDLAHFGDPRFPVYANVNAQPVESAALARRLLVEQLTAPVQWARELEHIAALHPDALYVELGPGAVLKGLAKKIAPAIKVVPCGTAADVDALLTLVTA
ncbi:MAG: ACP S-malonyltransferase [Gemmatimonadaceae bacterium]|nr:ACP S-malonyltransferase [Gemmatimonadaceae bacterium]NUO94088.1 ACP S-malonyltransferase [Gemmatimonadaceae bacterium]NUP72299.1 ACP S-malonyltransferase [Gemmatimonadaceae bacterium]NUR33524.1 ACP S-malonyltransferase [Gemmatimonadaceae bacterium]NUS33294.1 ACP S-malonyltransferase [Gemmatimonadaceae bacterium]